MMGGDPTPSAGLGGLDDLIGIGGGSVGGGGSAPNEDLDHPIYHNNKDDFASSQTVNIPLLSPLNEKSTNGTQWKALVPSNINEGVIYQDDEV